MRRACVTPAAAPSSTGFAPAEAPEVAIVVMVDHGGGGGRVAAPIAIQILQEYLGSREGAVTAMAAPARPGGGR